MRNVNTTLVNEARESLERPAPDGSIRAEIDLELVTPAYGGGTIPGVPDTRRLFRESGIRGQLRFWWRAARGAALTGTNGAETLHRLRAVEALLFGMTSNSRGLPSATVSRIRVNVVRTDATRLSTREMGDEVGTLTGRGYVYFPGRRTGRTPARSYWWGASLTLRIEVDVAGALAVLRKYTEDDWTEQRVRQEITAALWAWTTFGGYGARTRRGAGALRVVAVRGDDRLEQALVCKADRRDQYMRWLTDGAARLVAPWTDAFRAYPVISGATVALVTVGDSGRLPRGIAREEALIEVAGTLMRNFRQDRPKAQARTRWPEPNSLRRFFGTWDPRHNPGDGPSFYPRAALGLPIVFHFRGGKTVARHGQQNFEPNAELVGAEHDRLASPLILRPQVLKDEAVILALVLDTPWEPPGGLALKSAGGRERLPLAAGPVEGGERDGRHVLPLRERGAEDALTAFVRMLHADYGARIVTLEGRDGE